MAILVIGQREGSTLDIPTLHLLTTFSQIAGLASARRLKAMLLSKTLNHELQDKVQKISEQQRRIVTLQSQLSQMGASKSQPERTGDTIVFFYRIEIPRLHSWRHTH